MTLFDCAHLLRCPDDGSALVRIGDGLACSACQRRFPVLYGRVVDLRPRAMPELPHGAASDSYRSDHRQLATRPLELGCGDAGWGADLPTDRGWAVFLANHLAEIRELLARRPRTLADISAGAGHYSFALAGAAEVVFHCDLDPAAIAGGWRRAQEEQVSNLLFVRCDYLGLPFAEGCLDAVICTDTLIRGPGHERLALSNIRRVLTREGTAVVDFKAERWLRRRDDDCWYYRRAAVERLMAEAGFPWRRVRSFGCLPTRLLVAAPVWHLNRPLARLLGPTRFVVAAGRQKRLEA